MMFVTFPFSVLCLVWYLIVSISYLCLLPYLDIFNELSGLIWSVPLILQYGTLYNLSYQMLHIGSLNIIYTGSEAEYVLIHVIPICLISLNDNSTVDIYKSQLLTWSVLLGYLILKCKKISLCRKSILRQYRCLRKARIWKAWLDLL